MTTAPFLVRSLHDASGQPAEEDAVATPRRSGRRGSCRMIEIGEEREPRGDLSFLETGRNVPFDIRRVFYIANVPARTSRARHALRSCEQLIVALNGAFDIVTDDGRERTRWRLDDSSRGLYLPAMVWREVGSFSPGAICLVLASERYSEGDYIRSHDEFRAELARQP